jgi:mannose-1-phosphate guanylyltransferase/mannose-6-phosphate isomerase
MAESNDHVYAVLLAGGTGTRLWPVSRELYPKQLVRFIGDDSLVQSTVKRLLAVVDRAKIRIVCGEQHFHEIARHLEHLGIPAAAKIIREPCGRNTAPAILLAAFHVRRLCEEAILCVFPADHVIAEIRTFHGKVRNAIRLAANGHLVTFGIKPNYPETGYGYIEGGQPVSGGAYQVKRFVEKPDLATAKGYIRSGNFFWNSGMFAFKVSTILQEFKIHQPHLLAAMTEMLAADEAPSEEDYARLENISIDYAIMEKTARCVVLPSDFGWSDIGSWKSLYDFLEKDENLNVVEGDVIAQDTRNCFILGHDRLIATNHLRDLVVVDTPDSVFISDLNRSREVKTIVSELKERGRKEYQQHRTVYHPWGLRKFFEHGSGYTACELSVYPNAAFLLPATASADHHLLVLQGRAAVTTGSVKRRLKRGESISCKAQRSVRIENAGERELVLVHIALKDASE